MYHFIIICEYKLELQSGNTKFGSESTMFFVSGDLEIWQMTFKNNMGPSPMLLQALCIVSKPLENSNWSYSLKTPNLGQNRWFFLAMWPWNLMYDLENPLLSNIKLCVSFIIICIQTGVMVWKQLSCVLTSVTLTLIFCMDITSVIGNNSWKFHHDTMMGT